MAKRKPCNLTKKEWALFCEIFQFFHDNNDLTEKEVEEMESIHNKCFFMDYIIKENKDGH